MSTLPINIRPVDGSRLDRATVTDAVVATYSLGAGANQATHLMIRTPADVHYKTRKSGDGTPDVTTAGTKIAFEDGLVIWPKPKSHDEITIIASAGSPFSVEIQLANRINMGT